MCWVSAYMCLRLCVVAFVVCRDECGLLPLPGNGFEEVVKPEQGHFWIHNGGRIGFEGWGPPWLVNGDFVAQLELGNVPPDPITVWVETPALCHWVEPPARGMS